MKYNKNERDLILRCWNNRESGMHGWISRKNMWLTIEPFEDSGEDFLTVCVTDKIDSMGYAFGNVYAYENLFEDDIREMIHCVENKLNCGDQIVIHFSSDEWPFGYADCTYKCKQRGEHVFESNTYGWKYIVNTSKDTVICTQNPKKIYRIDNKTGWTDYLP